MSLPSEPIAGLQTLLDGLSQIITRLDNNQVELQQLRELARTAEVINSMLDLDQVLDDVIDTVITLTRAERGFIVLKNQENGELEFRVARNMNQSDLSDEDYIVSRTVVERVAREGQPVVTVNAQEDQRLIGSESVANYMLRSILCVPLNRKDNVIGVIYADNRFQPGLFTGREEQLVYAFANQAAIAIENARLFERVRASLAEITQIKEFMDNVFASIGSGVITADGGDQIMAINAAAARILDILSEDSTGQSLWSVLPILYDGFRLLVEEVRGHDVEQMVEVEPVLERRGQISLSLKLSPFKDAGQVTQGVAIVLDDLTEAKQREAQLSAIRRYLPPAVIDNIQSIDELELGGVELEISVVHCDVRGFSTFSETLPPEELMQVINKYLGLSSEAINTYEGIIDKYMGDAVVGLYNTQLNHLADHALRAVKTALMMARQVRALHEVLPPDQQLFYGIGVNSGPAILGNVGSPRRKEFTAIGDTLEFAKLLQENALGGEIIISQSTYDLVQAAVIAEPLTPRKLKDQRAFTVMYRVTGLVE
jgi:class 3 adenylate cyclase/PAS domain-containing protein